MFRKLLIISSAIATFASGALLAADNEILITWQQYQKLAALNGQSLGHYQACGDDVTGLSALIMAEHSLLEANYAYVNSMQLDALFLKAYQHAINTFNLKDRPCRNPGNRAEFAQVHTELLQLLIARREGEAERIAQLTDAEYTKKRRHQARTWLEVQPAYAPKVNLTLTENRIDKLLMSNKAAEDQFVFATMAHRGEAPYEEAVRRHTRRLAALDLTGAALETAASFNALRDINDFDSTEAVIWSLQGRGSYEDAMKAGLKATARFERKTPPAASPPPKELAATKAVRTRQ